MKKFLRILVRFITFLPAFAIQALWYYLVYSLLKEWSTYLNIFLFIYQVFAIIYIFNKREEANYKLLWITTILIFPFAGIILYFLAGNKKSARPIHNKINRNKIYPLDIPSLALQEHTLGDQTMTLLHHLSSYPITPVSHSKFYPLGDDMFPDMVKALKEAKHFIFIEYFIIEKGVFWNTIVEILKEKVKEGVVVKVLYDDIGSISTYSIHSQLELKRAGIDLVSFNPIIYLAFRLNNRDHRKMMIIDNEIAFSGGVNLADEYINQKTRFGHWKDIGFFIKGEPVWVYTHLFCLFWNAYSKHKIDERKLYRPELDTQEAKTKSLTYFDSPYFDEAISNRFFVSVLGSAKDYAYFYTPYLILNDSLKEAFIQASQRGVDVRIFIPGIPDKKMVYSLTLKYAETLAKYGVKVYRYLPGFVHAKGAVIDDKICSIGSVNLDYRSLYLHFESNTVFMDSEMVFDVKADFLKTQEKCEQVHYKKHNIFVKLYRSILDIFSPLF